MAVTDATEEIDLTAIGPVKSCPLVLLSSPLLPAIPGLHSLSLCAVGNGNTDWAERLDQWCRPAAVFPRHMTQLENVSSKKRFGECYHAMFEFEGFQREVLF